VSPRNSAGWQAAAGPENSMSRFSSAVVLLAVAACSVAPAGGRHNGGGGSPGGGGSGGSPGGVAPATVELSFLSFEIGTQAWGVHVSRRRWLPIFLLRLDEETGGCGALDGYYLGPSPHALDIGLEAPAVGNCPTDSEVPGGCRISAHLEVGRGRGIPAPYGPLMIQPTRAILRIDRFEGGKLEGEFRAWFPVDPEVPTSGAGPGIQCVDTRGAIRWCDPGAQGEDCCNAGKAEEEVVVPVDATFCPSLSYCEEPDHCEALEAAAACPPPELDCETSCARHAELCVTCANEGFAYPVEWFERQCAEQVDDCPAACAAAAGRPLAAVGMACLAMESCDDWIPCLARCGGEP
jgi:hypothetical protein